MVEPDSPAGDSMRYRMLGEDVATDSEKLAKYTGEVDWSYLEPHYQAGVLLYVDPSLELATVGKAFAADASEQVQAWLRCGDLVKPSDPHALYWKQSKATFTALVVSPFVLIQPLAP